MAKEDYKTNKPSKKILSLSFFLIFLLIFSYPLTFSQEDSEEMPNEEKELKENINGTKQIPSRLKDKTNEAIKEEIEIPEWAESIASIFFGIKKEKTTDLQTLIILIGCWLMLFFLIQSGVQLMAEDMLPALQGFKSWIFAFFVTSLVGISGGASFLASFFFDLGNFIGVLEGWGFFKIVIALVIFALLVIAGKKLANIARNHFMIEKAKEEGTQAAAGATMNKSTYESYQNLNG